MKKLVLILCLFIVSAFSYGRGYTPFTLTQQEDHPNSEIIGEEIDLSVVGHDIGGRINDKLVMGEVSTAAGHPTSTLRIKSKNGLTATTTFMRRQDGSWGGTIQLGQKRAEITLVKIMQDLPGVEISVNGKSHIVKIEAHDFRNNHFINPTYNLYLGQKIVKAKLVHGQACWMYSLHLIFMIYGTYLI